jgi:hypothetical protein
MLRQIVEQSHELFERLLSKPRVLGGPGRRVLQHALREQLALNCRLVPAPFPTPAAAFAGL